MNSSLLHNIRFYILLFSTLLAVTIFIQTRATIPEESVMIFHLTQYYALTAVTFLYTAVIITPLFALFPQIPFQEHIQKARRAIGVSAFSFSAIHAYLAFFKQLGGFSGLAYLNSTYLLAITLSTLSLLILSLMAATSFDKMIRLLGFKRWKKLHRFVYLAATFITIHALLLGSHFQNLSTAIPKIFLIALVFLLVLESIRFSKYLRSRFQL